MDVVLLTLYFRNFIIFNTPLATRFEWMPEMAGDIILEGETYEVQARERKVILEGKMETTFQLRNYF